MRRLHAKRLEKRDVLGGVAQVILAADDVRDVHFQIVNDVHQMKHRLAVRALNDEIGLRFLAVGEFADNFADDQILDDDRLALHLEFDRAFVFVGEAARQQCLDAALVIFLPLALEIGAEAALARAGGVAGERPSSQSRPSQRRPLRMTSTASCELRAASVSSMRRMNVPPVWRA